GAFYSRIPSLFVDRFLRISERLRRGGPRPQSRHLSRIGCCGIRQGPRLEKLGSHFMSNSNVFSPSSTLAFRSLCASLEYFLGTVRDMLTPWGGADMSRFKSTAG